MDFMGGGLGLPPGHPGGPPWPRPHVYLHDTDDDPGAAWLGGHHRDDGSPCVHGVLASQAAAGPVPEGGYTCRDGRPWGLGRRQAPPLVVAPVEYEAVTAAPRPAWVRRLARFLLGRAALIAAVVTGVAVTVAAAWLIGSRLPLPWSAACLAAGLLGLAAWRRRR